jgi:excisionase family DNA binding protein
MADLVPRLAWTCRQLAAALGVSEPTIRTEIRLGRLRAHGIGSKTVVLSKDLEEYLDNLPERRLKKIPERYLPAGYRNADQESAAS